MNRKNDNLRKQIDRMEYALDCIILGLKAKARDNSNKMPIENFPIPRRNQINVMVNNRKRPTAL